MFLWSILVLEGDRFFFKKYINLRYIIGISVLKGREVFGVVGVYVRDLFWIGE